MFDPLEALSSATEPSNVFATQTWVPSEATPSGSRPTEMDEWITDPLEELSSVTDPLEAFVTQT
jgi:hypothetical protein